MSGGRRRLLPEIFRTQALAQRASDSRTTRQCIESGLNPCHPMDEEDGVKPRTCRQTSHGAIGRASRLSNMRQKASLLILNLLSKRCALRLPRMMPAALASDAWPSGG